MEEHTTPHAPMWTRPGDLPDAKALVLRALPAVLMLVLGTEALRVGIQCLAGSQNGAFLFVLPVRTLSPLEAVGAIALALAALGRGIAVFRSTVWQGLPLSLEKRDGEYVVYGDGIGYRAAEGRPEKPICTVKSDRVVMVHVISRRRSRWPQELRVWTGAWGSRVVAVAESQRDLEELKALIEPVAGRSTPNGH